MKSMADVKISSPFLKPKSISIYLWDFISSSACKNPTYLSFSDPFLVASVFVLRQMYTLQLSMAGCSYKVPHTCSLFEA
ncbi:hypothetical protein H5410_018825 [Solanum commersonii]|uniref:Uncharacterized protein n=1 Tax=Solanum commersonii TaxID=4109 RepID=A0A9J6A399_SOLCO|nr:hypothetical protein H5410_018825 [Solanum commersonii]